MWRNVLYIHSFLYCEQRAFCPHAHIRRLCSIQSVPDDIYSLSKRIQYGNHINLCRYEAIKTRPIASSNGITDRRTPRVGLLSVICFKILETSLRFSPVKKKYGTWEVITKVSQCSLVVRHTKASKETSANICCEITASRFARNVTIYVLQRMRYRTPHNRHFKAVYFNGVWLGWVRLG